MCLALLEVKAHGVSVVRARVQPAIYTVNKHINGPQVDEKVLLAPVAEAAVCGGGFGSSGEPEAGGILSSVEEMVGEVFQGDVVLASLGAMDVGKCHRLLDGFVGRAGHAS